MVPLRDAIVQHCAVVVEVQDAMAALIAVGGTRRAPYLAGGAVAVRQEGDVSGVVVRSACQLLLIMCRRQGVD